MNRWPRALRPFAEGQYRLLVAALTASLFGSGMWLVAVVWQVIAMDGGPGDLSLVATAAAVGLLAAVLLGGVAADRLPRRSILIAVEATKALTTGVGAALAISGGIEIWHLVVISLVLGLADAFFYPAYSALLPSILPADQLLAANGMEGMLRPVILQAIGPVVASAAISAFSPGHAIAVVALLQAAAVLGLAFLRSIPVVRDLQGSNSVKAALVDIREGFRCMVKTPWLLATLLFACAFVLLTMGPIQVLLPFVVRDQLGGGPQAFAYALAAFGLGGAAGSLAVASRRLPRRYLTAMNLAWGLGCLPMMLIGFSSQLWLVIVALALTGFTFSAGNVIWGTLLQRRVPPELLGRVSSLDFFVSLALMPVSMALAGPVGERLGYPLTFALAGSLPLLLAFAAIYLARMPKDELEHPLDTAVVTAQDQA